MPRSNVNNASASNTQSSQEQPSVSDGNAANVVGVTASMPSSTTIGVTAITAPVINPASTMNTAALTQSGTMASMPPILGFTSPSMANSTIGNMPFNLPMHGRNYPYGIPTSLMAGLQTSTSTYVDNAVTGFTPVHSSSEGIYSRNAQPSLSTASLLAQYNIFYL